MRKIILLLIITLFFYGCSTKNNLPLLITSKTNEKEMVYLRIDYQWRYAITFPSYLTIENISYSTKSLNGIVFYPYDISTYSYIYRENGDNYMQPIPVLKKNEKIVFKVDIILPIDSIKTRKILEYYKYKEYPSRNKMLSLSTYEDFVKDLKKIKVTKDSTLYSQIFKEIIFYISISNIGKDTRARAINYDWLNNKTYDKFPNSEMVDIVK